MAAKEMHPNLVKTIETPPEGFIHFTNIADVKEVAISEYTEDHDQGWSRVLIMDPINGAPDLLLSAFRMAPHQHHARHFHGNMGEIYFIHEGRARLLVGERTEWVSKGAAIYVPKGTPHCIDTGDEGATVLVIFPSGVPANIHKEFVEDTSERF